MASASVHSAPNPVIHDSNSRLSRRGIIGAILCAPAIVRASSLMPVKAFQEERSEAELETMLEQVVLGQSYVVGDFLTGEFAWSMGLPETWKRNRSIRQVTWVSSP